MSANPSSGWGGWLGGLLGRQDSPRAQGQPDRRSRDHDDQAEGGSRGILGWLRDKLGGWPGARAAKGTLLDEEVRSERVRSGPSGVKIPWFLPYFDDQQTLSESSAMRLAYRKMLAWPEVKAAFLGKVLDVCALDLKVLPADKRSRRYGLHADFTRWQFTEALEGGVPGLIWSILSGGLIDGYSVNEKVLDREERGEYAGNYYLRACKPKDTGRDLVLETDEFRNVTGVRGLRYNPGTIFHPSRFVLFRHLPLWDTATGMSDLRAAYGSWWMLDTAKKLRAIGLEKRALPVIYGQYQTAQQRPSLEAALALVKSQNWLAVPEGIKLDVLNIAGSADGIFHQAIADLKHDIFLAIQGAILQSLEGSTTDGRGNSEVHRSTADLLVWYLATCVEHLFNDRRTGLIRDTIDLNYVTDRYPRAKLGAVDLAELQGRADLYEKAWSMGLELSKEEVYEELGIKPPDASNPDDVLSKAASEKAQQPPPGGAPGLPGTPPAPPAPAPPAKHGEGDWDESKHPRGEGGKFGKGGGKPAGKEKKGREAAALRAREWAEKLVERSPRHLQHAAAVVGAAMVRLRGATSRAEAAEAISQAKREVPQMARNLTQALEAPAQAVAGRIGEALGPRSRALQKLPAKLVKQYATAWSEEVRDRLSEMGRVGDREAVSNDRRTIAQELERLGEDLLGTERFSLAGNAFVNTIGTGAVDLVDAIEETGWTDRVSALLSESESNEEAAKKLAKFGIDLPAREGESGNSYDDRVQDVLDGWTRQAAELIHDGLREAILGSPSATKHGEGDWDESKHPRGEGGKFGKGGGGGSKKGQSDKGRDEGGQQEKPSAREALTSAIDQHDERAGKAIADLARHEYALEKYQAVTPASSEEWEGLETRLRDAEEMVAGLSDYLIGSEDELTEALGGHDHARELVEAAQGKAATATEYLGNATVEIVAAATRWADWETDGDGSEEGRAAILADVKGILDEFLPETVSAIDDAQMAMHDLRERLSNHREELEDEGDEGATKQGEGPGQVDIFTRRARPARED